MKINLPNPDDFDQDIDGFFDQLELSVYHARKSWEKIKAKYTTEDLEGDCKPFVSFRIPELQNEYDTYFKIVDDRKDQEIVIEISEA